MVGAIIVGAGEGKRMGGGGRKQFVRISGRPLIAYTLEVFEKSALIDHMVIVVPRDSIDWLKEEIIEPSGLKKINAVVHGGETRQQSVLSGLRAVKHKTERIVIHDAVRPLVSEILIKRVLDASQKTGAAITAVPARDTVKRVESGVIVGTLNRRLLWLAQTPQCFRNDILSDAHKRALKEKVEATDDASLVEKYGTKVAVAVGSYSNLKITSPEDLPLFEYFLRQDMRAKLHSAQGKKPKQRPHRGRRQRSRRR